METKTIQIKQNSYPWTHLFEDETEQELGSELLVDPHAQVQAHKGQIEELTNEVKKQKNLVSEQDAHLKKQHDNLMEMKTVSTKTFDGLQAKIDALVEENKNKADTIKKLQATLSEKTTALEEATLQFQQELSKQPDNNYSELVYQILIYGIVHHKAGLTGKTKKEKTLQSIVRWLQQRRNVVDYLRRHQIHSDTADELENILFVDEATLNDMLAKLSIE